MSVLLPRDLDWGVANWVSFAFFNDCLPHLEATPHLAHEIRFCLEAEVDTLDLRGAGRAELVELQHLVQRVVANQLSRDPTSFIDHKMHPTYVAKLGQLQAIVDRALAGAS
jgi:hypothetical protein